MAYKVNIEKRVAKANPFKNNANLLRKIHKILSETPFPHQHNEITRLVQWKRMYRLRVGDYRVIYEIKGNDVNITEIGPRSNIYK